jgi:5-methylcytosine-specific restriction endonuclease McrA
MADSLERKKMIARARGQFDILGNVICAVGREARHIEDMEVDHIYPRRAGGSDDITNLQLVCPRHNRSKGGKVMKRKKSTDSGPHWTGLKWDIG